MPVAVNPLDRETKRSKPRKKPVDFRINDNTILESEKPVDFSFKNYKFLTSVGIEGARETRIHHIPAVSSANQKYLTRALWLNNNKLTKITNLDLLVESVLEKPMKLGWLDFSFNYITTIDDVITKYSNLSILYFHGNLISDYGQVAKLKDLKNLRSVTFHGNPITKDPNYRMTLMLILPQIVNLDFSPILKSERLMSAPPNALRTLSEIFENPGEGLQKLHSVPNIQQCKSVVDENKKSKYDKEDNKIEEDKENKKFEEDIEYKQCEEDKEDEKFEEDIEYKKCEEDKEDEKFEEDKEDKISEEVKEDKKCDCDKEYKRSEKETENL